MKSTLNIVMALCFAVALVHVDFVLTAVALIIMGGLAYRLGWHDRRALSSARRQSLDKP